MKREAERLDPRWLAQQTRERTLEREASEAVMREVDDEDAPIRRFEQFMESELGGRRLLENARRRQVARVEGHVERDARPDPAHGIGRGQAAQRLREHKRAVALGQFLDRVPQRH
jgi:hypothetical protein